MPSRPRSRERTGTTQSRASSSSIRSPVKTTRSASQARRLVGDGLEEPARKQRAKCRSLRCTRLRPSQAGAGRGPRRPTRACGAAATRCRGAGAARSAAPRRSGPGRRARRPGRAPRPGRRSPGDAADARARVIERAGRPGRGQAGEAHRRGPADGQVHHGPCETSQARTPRRPRSPTSSTSLAKAAIPRRGGRARARR